MRGRATRCIVGIAGVRGYERDVVAEYVHDIRRTGCLTDGDAPRAAPNRHGLRETLTTGGRRRVTPRCVEHRHRVGTGVGDVEGRGRRVEGCSPGVATD